MSFLPLFSGLGFAFFPSAATAMAGWPLPSSASHRSYVQLVAVREAFLALVVMTLWLAGEVQAVGWVLVVAGVIPAVDGWVALQHGTTLQVLQHWGSIVALVAVGYGLIRTRK